MNRFKIDLNEYISSYFPFALFRARKDWRGRIRWVQVESFATQADARARYELVKDLPEYLP